MINELETSYKYVCDNSIDVKINYDKIDNLIELIESSNVTYWLDSNPYNIMDMDVESIINFLLIYHTIGDYCFWGDPKWTINTDKGNLDGSFAIMYIIVNRYIQNPDFNMSLDEFNELLKGNGILPLLEDRYNNLVEMNNYLGNKSFYNIIKDMTTDIELLEHIISNLKYFEDISDYNGNKILFYKRAQLLTSDILHVRELKEKIKVDYTHLIGCADYKIPQVMRCYGMLEFSEYLSHKVDNMIPLDENSSEEVEIRANTLQVINYIYEKLNKKYPRMDINDFIWLLGQDKSKMIKPYHRTLTKHY
jgi:hypothetical protein